MMSITHIQVLLSLVLLAKQSKHEFVGAGRSFFVNQRAFQPTEIDKTTAALGPLAMTSCKLDHIGATFSRESMEHLGIAPSQLALGDPRCVANVNSTHYILSSNSTNCGTTVNWDSNESVQSLSNRIIISPPNVYDDMDSTNHGPDVVNRSVGQRDDPVVIKITCRNSVQPQLTSQDNSGNHSTSSLMPHMIKLELYSTDAYSSTIRPDISKLVKGTSIYAQVSIIDEKLKTEANVYIDSCYLVARSYGPRKHYLIKNGCPEDTDVQFKQDNHPYLGSRRFLFRAPRPFRKKAMALECTVIQCHSSQCTSQHNYCKSMHDHGGNLELPSPITVNYQYAFSVRKRRPTDAEVSPKIFPEPTTKSTTITSRTTKVYLAPRSCPPPAVQKPCRCPINVAKSDSQTDKEALVPMGVTIGIAIAMFCVGGLLVALLWLIYVVTDPRRKMKPVTMSDDGMSSSQDSANPRDKLVGSQDAATSSIQS